MDTNRKLVDSTFCWCVGQGYHKRRLCGSKVECRVLHDVWHPLGLIGNGGFHYLFSGISKNRVRKIISAFQTIGASRAAELIQEAFVLYSHTKSSMPSGTDYAEIRKGCYEEMSRIEDEFYGLDSVVVSAAADYVRVHFSVDGMR